jgi:DNA replication and repair protein RecF
LKIAALELNDFRNFAEARLQPSERSTILVGENGQGKTNLLEAIYLLTTLKPLRAARLGELVRFGTARARVAGDLALPGGIRQVAVEVEPGGRRALVDGKVQERLDGYFEGLAAICFSPDDLMLVKGGPDGRRRHLDRGAFNRWPAVLGEAREFQRALKTRNATLRQGNEAVESQFRATLARAGARILTRRIAWLGEISTRLAGAYARIAGSGAPPARIEYLAAGGMSLEGAEEELCGRLEEMLAGRLERDRDRGYTSVGPQADDFAIVLGERGARSYASQGQQRALVLALKIAEIENLREVLGRPPLLLLDDVSSELDPEKNRALMEYVASLPGQAFLTATDRRLLEPAAGPDSVFVAVSGGAVSARFRQ